MVDQGIVIGRGINFSIENLFKLWSEKPSKIRFNTEYQRSYIWTPTKKQLLIDSILRDYDINKIFLRQLENGMYECLDGQQRLRSIFDFLSGDFALGESSNNIGLQNKKISDLQTSYPQFYYKLLYYKIDAVVVYQADDETTSDIFLRLQEGIPLNSAEKLNAMRGTLRNRVVELSRHSFWQSIGIENYRFGHRYICAQIALLELTNTNLPENGIHVSDVKFPKLRHYYQLYKAVDPPEKVLGQIRDTLKLLHDALGQKASIIRQKGDIIPIYLLASYLLRRYGSVKQNGDKFRNFIEDFLTKVYAPQASNEYFDYKYARSRSTESRKSIGDGFKVILGKFLEFEPDLQLKDDKRLFDYGQKLAIYYRDEGLCQGVDHEGDDSLKFEEAEFHHIKPWHEGGRTTVANGVLLCTKCHAKQPKFSKTE